METTLQTTETKSIQDIKNMIADRNANSEAKLQELIAQQTEYNRMMNLHTDKLESMLPAIEKSLSKMGLAIGTISYGKSGGWDSKVWGADDRLNVSIGAVPVGGKFKFYTDKGFNSRGNYKNGDMMNNKAHKMAETLRNETGAEHASVNQYSLQVKNENETKRVLIDLCIKA